MYRDISPGGIQEYWTVALVRNEEKYKEVHFGVFMTLQEAIEASESGNVRVMDDEHLELRRIRQFPKK